MATSISKQLALKIKLERIFKKDVTRVFNAIAEDFKISIAATNTPPMASIFTPTWEVALRTHYKRVQKAFTGMVKQETIEGLYNVFLTWRNQRAPIRASEITETTRKNMTESLQLADLDAIEEGVILTPIERAAKSAAILKKKFKTRTQTLINTETQAAAESAKFMEAELLSDVKPRILGGNEESSTRKRWTTVGDKRVRPAHRLANGQTKKLNEPYIVAGEYLMHPGDLSMGASVGNVANCLHPNSIVNFASPSKLMRRWYDGKMITIKTHSGNEITVTPNHPILSDIGFVRAGEIKEGFDIICRTEKKWRESDFNVKNVKTAIEKIFNSFETFSSQMGRIGGVVNFHGDISYQGVDIITSNRGLLNARNIFGPDPFSKFIFRDADFGLSQESIYSSFFKMFLGFIFKMNITDLITFFMCGGNLFFSLIWRHLTPFERFGFASSSWSNIVDFENSFNGLSLKTNSFMNFVNRKTGIEKIDDFFEILFMSFNKSQFNGFGLTAPNIFQNSIQSSLADIKRFLNFCKLHSINIGVSNVIDIRQFDYSGYVYNLEDYKSYYICNGFVNHNCRCISTYSFY